MTITFDQSIVKIREDGVQVLSNVLLKGEVLANGETYEDAKERLSKSMVGVYIEPDTGESSGALTLDPTGTSTVPAEDMEAIKEALAHPEVAEDTTGDASQTLTLNVEENGSTPADGDAASDTGSEDDSDDESDEGDDTPENEGEDKTGVLPKESDPKSVWFEYALGKGHQGEYDDITKNQLIAQYGA